VSSVKYPTITVQLTGKDGNAFSVLGEVSRELRRAGVSQDEQDEFFAEATQGDYNHLLRTAMEWVTVE